MATALQLPRVEPAPFPRRKLFTRQECARLQGIVDLERYELIAGDLIEKVGKNRPHMLADQAVLSWLMGVFGGSLVLTEPSIDLRPEDNPTTELQPDLLVLNRPLREIESRPGPPDIALVVEVSDSTLAFDLSVKRDLYARAAIADYWVLDVNARRVIVHREPVAGSYQSIIAYLEHDHVAPLGAPAHQGIVSELLSI